MNGKQKSIMARIRRMVIIGIIILVIVLETASIISIQNAMNTDTANEIALEASGEIRYIDGWLAKKVEETELIAASVQAMGTVSDAEMEAYLISCADLDTEVLNFYFCRGGVPYVVYNGGIFELDPTSRSWWTTAWSAGKTIITDAYADSNSGAIVVSIATPFYQGSTQCVVLADITMDALVTTLMDLDDEKLSIFLTGSDGTVIVHKNSDYLMKVVNKETVSTNIFDKYAIDSNSTEVQMFIDETGTPNKIVMSKVESTGWIIGAYIPESYTAQRVLISFANGIIAAVLISVIGIIYLAVVLKKELAPLAEMKTFVRDVVVGKENVGFYKREKDEIAFLIKALKEKFVDIIRKTKTEMAEIDVDIRETNSSVRDIVDEMNNISAVIEETAASMDTQTSNIANISDDCSVITNASVTVANQAQEMAGKSAQIVDRINGLAPKMKAEREESLKSCRASQAKVEAAVKEAECIKEITSISDAIRGIADQTNLLSLNASIESARAGEAGRGFAVVAQEIRSLSDETGKEIDKISNLTDRLLKAVEALSKESTESMEKLSGDIEHAYDTVDTLSQEYVESANYYSSISSELGASSEELSASVQTVAKSIEDISTSQNDVNKAMENASHGVQVIADNTVTVKDKVEKVSDAVDEVSRTVQQFNV